MAFTGYSTQDSVSRKDSEAFVYFDSDPALLYSAILAGAKKVNELLDQRFHVPVPVLSDGSYDQALVDANDWFVVAEGRTRRGLTESGDAANQRALDIVEDINTGRRALQSQITLDELGLGGVTPGDSNSGTGDFELDRLHSRYTGEYRATYVVTITASGASGTATYSVTKDGESLATGTTAKTWIALEDGIRFRFVGANSGSFVSGDTWTFICQPSRQGTDAARVRSIRILST